MKIRYPLLILMAWTWGMIDVYAGPLIYYREMVLHYGINPESVFFVPKEYDRLVENQGQHDFTVTVQDSGMRFQATAFLDQNDGVQNGEFSGVINELAYDFSLAGLDFSLGKKVSPWGVGYGFRPLDTVQREQRLSDQPRPLEGIPMLSLEYYTEAVTLSTLWINRMTKNRRIIEFARNEWVFKTYLSLRQTDVFSLVHYKSSDDYIIGAGFSSVFGTSLEVHASATYTSRYQRLLRDDTAELLSRTDPTTTQMFQHGKKVLLGLNWTWPNGLGILAETWYDETAYTKEQWDLIRETAELQNSLVGGDIPDQAIYDNISWDSRMYQMSSLGRTNVLLRLSYQGERFDPALDFLWLPQNNGMMFRASFTYEMNNYSQWFFSIRTVSGNKNSAAGNVPVNLVVLTGLTASFEL